MNSLTAHHLLPASFCSGCDHVTATSHTFCAALLCPHLALLEDGDLLLQRDVLLLQLGVVLQQASLQQLVLLDVITQLIPLELHHLAVLWVQRE